MWIDSQGDLRVGAAEIPTAETVEFGDARIMAETDGHSDHEYAIRELQEWEARLDQREAQVAAREQKMDELRRSWIVILSDVINRTTNQNKEK